MIINNSIQVKIVNATKRYWKELGYDVSKEYIDAKIADIPTKSTLKISCACVCGSIQHITVAGYYKNIAGNKGIYKCKKCSIEKTKQTCIERYGCSNPQQNEDIKQRTHETNIIRYGSKSPIQNEDIRKKIEDTTIERYGVKHFSKTDEFKQKVTSTSLSKYGETHFLKNDQIKKKKTSTNVERYGVGCTLQNDAIKAKAISTITDKYGTSHYMKSDAFKGVVKSKNKLRFTAHFMDILPKDYTLLRYDTSMLHVHHTECDSSFSITTKNYTNRINYKTIICTNCNKISENISGYEVEMREYIKSLGVKHELNNRTVLNGKEIDILLPDHNVAIEVNGLYWHSEIFKDTDYHINKTKQCQEKSFSLLHIFEDDWVYKKDIVKSIISNKLHLIESKIFARKCEIRYVGAKEAKLFLDENHIQGACRSKYKIGLYFNNRLVSLMTFGYRKTNRKNEFELIRFCNIINTNIIGAASKLFNFFISNHKIEEGYIVSYADISLFDGGMYERLGFNRVHLSKPNYFWVVNKVRNHRYVFNKQKLIKQGFDPNKTEVQIMHEQGLYRIYGCGQVRYVYQVEKSIF
jgi:hypothetical protein